MLSCICMLTWKYLYITVMALVGFSASAVQALTYQNGDYMGSLNKKASGAQCFIMALGLFWDIVTGLPWTPNGVGSLGPRGYCIFLPGAHYLTINSPYGADSSLNKLLLLLYAKRDVRVEGYVRVRTFTLFIIIIIIKLLFYYSRIGQIFSDSGILEFTGAFRE